MVQDSQVSQKYKLESQIREAYGRIVYTQTCHEKKIQTLLYKNECIKVFQIILSTITTGSFIAIIVSDKTIASIIGSIISLALLIINAFNKNFKLVELSQKHQTTANLLWKIREEYVSLLTDFEILDIQEIMSKRNELQERTAKVYSEAPRTDKKSYMKAQKVLKVEEEQTFSEKEIDCMLPNSIRRNKS